MDPGKEESNIASSVDISMHSSSNASLESVVEKGLVSNRQRQLRSKLVSLDSKNSFQLKPSCDIERYYQVADQVMERFLQHPIDTTEEIIEAYLMGSRLERFLSTILPTHPHYFSVRPARTVRRDQSRTQLAQLSRYTHVLMGLLDQHEHPHPNDHHWVSPEDAMAAVEALDLSVSSNPSRRSVHNLNLLEGKGEKEDKHEEDDLSTDFSMDSSLTSSVVSSPRRDCSASVESSLLDDVSHFKYIDVGDSSPSPTSSKESRVWNRQENKFPLAHQTSFNSSISNCNDSEQLVYCETKVTAVCTQDTIEEIRLQDETNSMSQVNSSTSLFPRRSHDTDRIGASSIDPRNMSAFQVPTNRDVEDRSSSIVVASDAIESRSFEEFEFNPFSSGGLDISNSVRNGGNDSSNQPEAHFEIRNLPQQSPLRSVEAILPYSQDHLEKSQINPVDALLTSSMPSETPSVYLQRRDGPIDLDDSVTDGDSDTSDGSICLAVQHPQSTDSEIETVGKSTHRGLMKILPSPRDFLRKPERKSSNPVNSSSNIISGVSLVIKHHQRSGPVDLDDYVDLDDSSGEINRSTHRAAKKYMQLVSVIERTAHDEFGTYEGHISPISVVDSTNTLCSTSKGKPINASLGHSQSTLVGSCEVESIKAIVVQKQRSLASHRGCVRCFLD